MVRINHTEKETKGDMYTYIETFMFIMFVQLPLNQYEIFSATPLHNLLSGKIIK